MQVTLLGTGTPILNIHRFGMSTLVAAAGQQLLFDAGRGVAMRLHQAKVRLCDLLTHLHSDHLTGLPDLYATAPLVIGGSRTVPLDVWGPEGVANVARGLELMFTENNRIRLMAKELAPEATTRAIKRWCSPAIRPTPQT
jgi:ribonuclease Z